MEGVLDLNENIFLRDSLHLSNIRCDKQFNDSVINLNYSQNKFVVPQLTMYNDYNDKPNLFVCHLLKESDGLRYDFNMVVSDDILNGGQDKYIKSVKNVDYFGCL